MLSDDCDPITNFGGNIRFTPRHRYAPTTEAISAWLHDHPESDPPIVVARALVEHALAAGGHDNITVAIGDVTP